MRLPDYRRGGWLTDAGVLLVPETSRVFFGADELLLCFDMERHVRLWEDNTDCLFSSWERAAGLVLMSAELEFGVWTETGEKLWTTFVNPPWTYTIEGDQVHIDDFDAKRVHDLKTGKPQTRHWFGRA